MKSEIKRDTRSMSIFKIIKYTILLYNMCFKRLTVDSQSILAVKIKRVYNVNAHKRLIKGIILQFF